MPVDDHPVHSLTKRSRHMAGCYNREPYAKGYWAQDGVIHGCEPWPSEVRTTQARMVWVPYRMSKDCQQDGTLPECQGCKHNRGDHAQI